MRDFLSSVARAFLNARANSLQRHCFVFPNKRAGKFFLKALRDLSGNPRLLAPDILTMGQLVASIADRNVIDAFQRIFTLYDCYVDLQPEGSQEVDFDNFLYWGETILKDFDQLDMNLVDAQPFFANVKNLREITTNYLTDEQRAIMERYWPAQASALNAAIAADHDDFWAHYRGKGRELKRPTERKFMRLWESLGPLYAAFHKALAEKTGEPTSPGGLYRIAARRLNDEGSDRLDPSWDSIVFIGFNSLSLSELKILDKLNSLNRADFYWDLPPVASNANPAARFVAAYARRLKSSLELEHPTPTQPDITIMAVPSSTGQAKVANRQISQWIADGSIPHPDNALDTAVVLPDPALFTPMVQGLPEEIKAFNVTMGIPVKLTAPAALMNLAASLHLNSVLSNGRVQYFAEDLKNLLAAPLVRHIGGSDADTLLSRIAARKQFRVDSEELVEGIPSLAPIFKPIKNMRGFEPIKEYVMAVLDIIASPPEDDGSPSDLHTLFTEAYRQALDSLATAIAGSRRLRSIDGPTVLRMLERALSARTVPFLGEPLSGLQIMGLLETRALDFDNLIVLSLNDGVLPAHTVNRSLIPDLLRRSVGLPTLEMEEASQAYIFYRLVMSARKVLLCYDSRQAGVGANAEMSRFIHQLIYAPPGTFRLRHGRERFPSTKFAETAIDVLKTPRVMAKLEQFKAGGKKNLSASALTTYLECPLRFYLQYVEGLAIDSETNDYIDYSTFGLIVHEALQVLYPSLVHGKLIEPNQVARYLPVKVTSQMLSDAAARPQAMIRPAIMQAIANNYPSALMRDGKLELTTGITAEMIEKMIVNLLLAEAAKYPGIEVLGAETSTVVNYQVSDSLAVNMRLIIDRTDSVGGKLRLVDYKTGSDETDFTSVDSLFKASSQGWPHAICQTFLYSLLYKQIHPATTAVQPIIYKLRSVPVKGLQPITKSKKIPVEDFTPYEDEFRAQLNQTIESIFNPSLTFSPPAMGGSCKFCNFKSFCGK